MRTSDDSEGSTTAEGERGRKADKTSTAWSVIVRAQGAEPGIRAAALGELIRRYERTVEGIIRRRWYPPSTTPEDLKQEFFLKVLCRNDFDRLDRSRGHFRSWLYRAVEYFMTNTRQAWFAEMRGNRVTAAFTADVAHGWTPDREVTRDFAGDTLAYVLERHEKEARHKREFGVLKRFLPGPQMEAGDLQSSAAELGITVPHLRVKIHRLQRTHRRYLREAVADTLDLDLSDPESARQVDLEMRLLYQALCEAPCSNLEPSH